MALASQYVVEFLIEGSLGRLHQPAEHLEHGVSPVVIAGQGPAARNVVKGVLGDKRPHRLNVAAGERLKCPSDGLCVRVLSHFAFSRSLSSPVALCCSEPSSSLRPGSTPLTDDKTGRGSEVKVLADLIGCYI
jgi:hypothetical protein